MKMFIDDDNENEFANLVIEIKIKNIFFLFFCFLDGTSD
jgi:hypothetical protein